MPPGEITLLMQRVDRGDGQAADQILPLVYEELRKLAAAKMARESAGQTLQPTALVHEAWLRLGGATQTGWKNRAHFFAAAAEAMRRLLIENARRKQRVRHGGLLNKVSASATGFDVPAPEMGDAELLRLNDALDRLAEHDARKAELVKHSRRPNRLAFFGVGRCNHRDRRERTSHKKGGRGISGGDNPAPNRAD